MPPGLQNAAQISANFLCRTACPNIGKKIEIIVSRARPQGSGVGTAKVYTLTHHFYMLIYVVWTLLGARETLCTLSIPNYVVVVPKIKYRSKYERTSHPVWNMSVFPKDFSSERVFFPLFFRKNKRVPSGLFSFFFSGKIDKGQPVSV